MFYIASGSFQIRNMQFAHILGNWRALPNSGEARVDWLRNSIATAIRRIRTLFAQSVQGRDERGVRREASAALVANVESIQDKVSESKVGIPWDGSEHMDLLNSNKVDSVFTYSCCSSPDPETSMGGHPTRRIRVEEAGVAIVRIMMDSDSPLVVEGLTGFGVSLYVSEPTQISDFGLWVFSSNRGRFRWSCTESATPKLKCGWNQLRFSYSWMQAPLENPEWGEIQAIQVFVESKEATAFNIGEIWAEVRRKASLLFIHDGGYSDFDCAPGYQDLLVRGIPVTWAVDCARIGDPTHVTRERLIELGNENNNLISFHGWTMAVSNRYKDSIQAREETANCQKWIRDLPTKGNAGWKWRSAWMQNRSPFSPATDDMVLMNPMWNPEDVPRSGPTMWPVQQPFNYHRQALHALSKRSMRELFDSAQRTHGVLICYTHNVQDGKSHISPELWDEFLRLIDGGLNQGWLEGVTFEMLSKEA